MKIGSHLQFEVPDTCPKDCIYLKDIRNYGQSAMCGRCPVLICSTIKMEDGTEDSAMVNPERFRDDWAKEWEKFFKEGGIVVLKLQHPFADAK